MKKFVYNFEPNGKDFFISAPTKKDAETTLKQTFGKLPYKVAETRVKRVSKTVSQFQFELNQLN